MKTAFRVDASEKIGTGHAIRCLTLAKELRSTGDEVFFVCRKLKGNLIEKIRGEAFRVISLPAPTEPISSAALEPAHASWLEVPWESDADQTLAALQDASADGLDTLVVDHYGLDARWESKFKGFSNNLMVIDDLADRAHFCDLLLDQNFFPLDPDRYSNQLLHPCSQLLGPQYALLSPEYAREHQRLVFERKAQLDHPIREVLVYFGGVDAGGETLKAIAALDKPDFTGLRVNVVIGNSNPHRETISGILERKNGWKKYEFVPDLVALTASADLCLGAGGTSNWERLCLGTPAIVVSIADNQIPIAANLGRAGFIIYQGHGPHLPAGSLDRQVDRAMIHSREIRAMGIRGMSLVDGLGAQRVAGALKTLRQP